MDDLDHLRGLRKPFDRFTGVAGFLGFEIRRRVPVKPSPMRTTRRPIWFNRMCGRFTYRYTWRQIHDLLSLNSAPVMFPARYNLAPSQSAPVVRADDSGRRLDFLRWGLIPPWAKDDKIGYKTINARAETVATSPAFRSAFRSRRCVVPVSGFYEWRKSGGAGRKPPFYISGADGSPLLFAGLWERWTPPPTRTGEAPPVETFTIVTTTPNTCMAGIHDRMPVILSAADAAEWMESKEPDSLARLLIACPERALTMHPVSPRVNSPGTDEAALIEPCGAMDAAADGAWPANGQGGVESLFGGS